jgi:hypothetical protein
MRFCLRAQDHPHRVWPAFRSFPRRLPPAPFHKRVLARTKGVAGLSPAADGILSGPRRGGRARFKAHAWNACRAERFSGVRIPPSPPASLGVSRFSTKRSKIFAFMRAFSPSRDPEKRPNSDHCEQVRRLISAGSEAGSLQIISAADPRLRRAGSLPSGLKVFIASDRAGPSDADARVVARPYQRQPAPLPISSGG